jgi:hypothetical protein
MFHRPLADDGESFDLGFDRHLGQFSHIRERRPGCLLDEFASPASSHAGSQPASEPVPASLRE